MKNSFYFFIAAFMANLMNAQIPANYYNGTSGLKGAALKTTLSSIITSGAVDNGYGGLWTAYATTDRDYFFEDDGTILDMYTEKPDEADADNFTYSTDQCGQYSVEGDCYNREHVVPQSLFNEASPMKNDVNFIRATDGKVNGMRNNYPFGVVTNPSYTSKNGGKLGSNTTSGYSGTVFEPIDTFKGDIARMIFYFVTRYESRLSGFSTGDMLGGSAFPGLQTWELNVLLAWHNADPVSIEETARNNAAYVVQKNRNPFIDHPEYVDLIWGTSVSDTQAPTAPSNLGVTSIKTNAVSLAWTASTDNAKVFEYDIYVDGALKTTVKKNKGIVYNLSPNQNYSFYVIARDIAGNSSTASSTLQAQTLAISTDTGASCGYVNFDSFTINTTSANYSTRTISSNGINWTSTLSRVDQLINNDPAICLKKGVLSATVPNGVSSFTITTQSKFGNAIGTSGNYVLKVNGTVKGIIPYSNVATTTTISDINVAGSANISLEEQNSSSTNRVAFNNLSWTCYNLLAVNEADGTKKLEVYPNPVKNKELYISGISNNEEVKIYNVNGQLVQSLSNVKDKQKITVSRLSKGVYILKTKDQSTKIIIE